MWWNFSDFAAVRHDLVHHPTSMAVWDARCLFLHGWDNASMAGRGVSRRALAAHVHPCWFCQTQCGPRDVLNKVWPCQSNFSPSFLYICCKLMQERRFFNLKKLRAHHIWSLTPVGVFFFLGEPSPSALGGFFRQVYVSEARAPLDMGGCNPGFHRFRLPAMKSLL